MASTTPLPDRLALFPLPGALVMPRAILPLQIFEPRYLAMFEDALKSDHRMIGMIQPAGDDLAPVGCAGRIVAFTETDDDRMLIQLRGISRFRLIEANEGFRPYLTGQIDWSEYAVDLGKPETDPDFQRQPFLDRLRRFMDAHDLATDWDTAEDADTENLINSLAMLLPLEPEEKQALLEAETLPKRRALLDGLVEYALHGGANEERLQ